MAFRVKYVRHSHLAADHGRQGRVGRKNQVKTDWDLIVGSEIDLRSSEAGLGEAQRSQSTIDGPTVKSAASDGPIGMPNAVRISSGISNGQRGGVVVDELQRWKASPS